MALCAKERYSKRELERQMESGYYERYMLSEQKPLPKLVPKDVRHSILDTYVLEFLDLPKGYSERNLRKAITRNLKDLFWNSARISLSLAKSIVYRLAARITILTFSFITGRWPVWFRLN